MTLRRSARLFLWDAPACNCRCMCYSEPACLPGRAELETRGAGNSWRQQDYSSEAPVVSQLMPQALPPRQCFLSVR